MTDTRFHKRTSAKTLGELADIAGGSLANDNDADTLIEDVAPLDVAGEGQLSFLDNVRYKDQFAATKAAACIVSPQLKDIAPQGVSLILSDTPYKSYALIAQSFYPDEKPESNIAGSASVADSAKIGEGALIEAGAVICANAELGKGCWIGANAVIGDGVVLGDNCRIGANATISHAMIGNNVRIYPGACIGQDGFGFAIDPAGHVKVPQLGRVIIGDSVEIGANTTIDRGAGPDTVIGQGTWIDNLVQIGHNVKVGRGCVIVSQAGISGSTVLEDYVVVAGQAGITGHLHIGMGAKIGAQSGVMKDVEPGQDVVGSPAMPIRQFMRQVAFLNRLVKKGNA